MREHVFDVLAVLKVDAAWCNNLTRRRGKPLIDEHRGRHGLERRTGFIRCRKRERTQRGVWHPVDVVWVDRWKIGNCHEVSVCHSNHYRRAPVGADFCGLRRELLLHVPLQV